MVAEVGCYWAEVRGGKNDGENENDLRLILANNFHDLKCRFSSRTFKCSVLQPRGTVKFAWASDLQGSKNLCCLRSKALRANFQDIDESILFVATKLIILHSTKPKKKTNPAHCQKESFLSTKSK